MNTISYKNMLIKFIVFAVLLGILTNACEMDQMQYGCRIFNGQCNCGYGCKSEYRYQDNEECKLALRGKRHDICSTSNPCQRGSCIQTSSEPGFKCRCEGTGFYGLRCERPCSDPGTARFRGPFPYECVVI